jgi:hypothetical protein
MRNVTPLVLAALLVGCSATPPPPASNYERQQHLAQWLNGLAPSGPPQDCLASYHQKEMTIVDNSTIVFRDGPGHVWVQKTQSACSPLAGPGPYALLTRSTVASLCSGDIAQVVETGSGMDVGSCVMGQFQPYSRPRAR